MYSAASNINTPTKEPWPNVYYDSVWYTYPNSNQFNTFIMIPGCPSQSCERKWKVTFEEYGVTNEYCTDVLNVVLNHGLYGKVHVEPFNIIF